MKITRRSFMKTAAGALGAAAVSPGMIASAWAKKASKPNILLIMADDMGYSDADCYGGDVRTPNLSELAAGGLRFTQHYSTGRCWPSRACVLSGYYAQQIRRDKMPGIKMGNRPKWAPLLPELLKPYGYRSYHSGKWHIDGQAKAAGFDRSWGSHRSGCDWDRFFDTGKWQEDDITAPVKEGEQYYSTVGIADHAITCLKLHQKQHADKPFFQYVAFYSPHFPLHAMQKDIDLYKNAYIDGWDKIRQRRWERMKKMGIINCDLSERHADIVPSWNLSAGQLKERIGDGEAANAVAWDTLTDAQKKFQATKMAIHAAMITRMDAEIGRIVSHLKRTGAYENTIIMFQSDNGASTEQIIRCDGHDKTAAPGSAKSYLCLGPGFATAANTPFRLHKHWNHEGGISSPFIVHWPKGIPCRGELRHNPTHFIDIVPTALELAGASGGKVANESGPPRPGISIVGAFEKDGAVDHDVLWWCHQGNRAIRMGDWKLSGRSGRKGEWELYNLKADRCEMNDLAHSQPERLKKMATRWEQIAEGFRKDLASDS